MKETRPAKKICIITPGYISSSPRVVKEADALKKAGFDVRVVFSQGSLEIQRSFDKTILQNRAWRWQAVGWSSSLEEERALYRRSRLRHNIFKRFPLFLSHFGKIAEYAEGRVCRELAALTASEEADIYIGHYPTGLAAAAYAASEWKSRLGYDMEDLYSRESPPNTKKQMKRIEIIERRYLSCCTHLTAVSSQVADKAADIYGIELPVTIYNVFPWADRENMDGQIKDRRGRRLSLYWYSQVIGEGRGIEDAIKASGLLKDNVEIHLRGYLPEGVKNKFCRLAKQCGINDNLYFHSPIVPNELLSRTAEHDIGLALEQPYNLSRRFSVTNKLFFYMLAGLAVIATDVPGQRSILDHAPNTGLLYEPGDYNKLAEHINGLLLDPGKLELLKRSALKAAKERWNWELESKKLVEAITNLLNGLSRT